MATGTPPPQSSSSDKTSNKFTIKPATFQVDPSQPPRRGSGLNNGSGSLANADFGSSTHSGVVGPTSKKENDGGSGVAGDVVVQTSVSLCDKISKERIV